MGVTAPVISIITPSFNRADLVTEMLESLTAQTLTAWECVVVDDGSADDTVAVISAYARLDPRVRLLKREREPKGACTCRNIAVEQAKGRFVLFLDTDDVLAPFCLQQRLHVLEHDKTLDFAIFPMLLFNGEVRTADRFWNVETGEDDLLRLLRLDPICQGTGTLWRRDSFIRTGMWDERLRIWQDVELHLRAFTGGYRFVKRLDLPPDVYLRETEASLSRGGYHSREKLESRARVVRQALVLLRRAGRSELIPQLRCLCAGVVLGAAGTGNLGFARELREWAALEGLWAPGDSRRLRFAEFCRASRLDRISGVRRLRDRWLNAFRARSTVGQIRLASRPADSDGVAAMLNPV